MYMESFPTAPYFLDAWEDFLVGALHTQEVEFLKAALGQVIPCSTILVSALVLPTIPKLMPTYYLPPMRSNAKIPYHLLRLRGTLAGIPNAFSAILRDETRKAISRGPNKTR